MTAIHICHGQILFHEVNCIYGRRHQRPFDDKALTMLRTSPIRYMNYSLDTSLPRGSGEDHLAGNVVCSKVSLSPFKNHSSGVGQTRQQYPPTTEFCTRYSSYTLHAVVAHDDSSMSTKNIVLFGETGAGKSSVVNLMAGFDQAKTSPDMGRCTMQWQEHPVAFGEHVYKVFDTIGLEEPQLGMNEYLNIIANAYSLIKKLNDEGGIDLLLFCVRAGRVTANLQTNYRLFYEWLCEKKVPIVLVLTGLEREEENMENWWTRNKQIFAKYEIHVAGHACITAANHLDGRHKQLYEESRGLVRDLIRTHTQGGGGTWNGGEGLFARFLSKLRELLQGKPRKHDVVSILTKRCHMPPEAAKRLAGNIRSDLDRP
jgi:GTPase SAR1 family protein